MGSNTVTANQLISTVATGTAPLTVASTTPVTNLQAEGALYTRTGTSWADANVRPSELGVNTIGVYKANNVSGSLNFPSATGNVALFERSLDWTTSGAVGSFMIWASNQSADTLWFRKLTSAGSWGTWNSFWHSGNAGTTSYNWSANILNTLSLGVGTDSPARLFEVVGGASAADTIVAQFRSNFTTTNTATTIRLMNTTAATNAMGVEISGVRTDVGGTGSHELRLRTSLGSVISDKVIIKPDGKIEVLIPTTTTSGTGTYNLNFNNNTDYDRTLTGNSTITCSNGKKNDLFFIKVTGNFTLAFGAGITVLNGATYDGIKGAFIGIYCPADGVYYAVLNNLS